MEIKQEQNEWIRQQLTDLWGESKAEYFLNPSIAAKTHQSNNEQTIKEHVTILTKRNQRNNNGIYFSLIFCSHLKYTYRIFKVCLLTLYGIIFVVTLKKKLRHSICPANYRLNLKI